MVDDETWKKIMEIAMSKPRQADSLKKDENYFAIPNSSALANPDYGDLRVQRTSPDDARIASAAVMKAYKPADSTETPFQLESLENWERGC